LFSGASKKNIANKIIPKKYAKYLDDKGKLWLANKGFVVEGIELPSTKISDIWDKPIGEHLEIPWYDSKKFMDRAEAEKWKRDRVSENMAGFKDKYNLSDEQFENYVDSAVKSVEGYTSDSYTEIRTFQSSDYLLKKGIIDEKIKEKLNSKYNRSRCFAILAESYIENSPRFDPKKPLYRGFTTHEELEKILGGLKAGDVFEDGAMTSWTTNENVARSFGDKYFKLEGGTPYTTSIRHLSGIHSEDEVLMGKGVKLEFVRRETDDWREVLVFKYKDADRSHVNIEEAIELSNSEKRNSIWR
jgi:hypothetical protein